MKARSILFALVGIISLYWSTTSRATNSWIVCSVSIASSGPTGSPIQIYYMFDPTLGEMWQYGGQTLYLIPDVSISVDKIVWHQENPTLLEALKYKHQADAIEAGNQGGGDGIGYDEFEIDRQTGAWTETDHNGYNNVDQYGNGTCTKTDPQPIAPRKF